MTSWWLYPSGVPDRISAHNPAASGYLYGSTPRPAEFLGRLSCWLLPRNTKAQFGHLLELEKVSRKTLEEGKMGVSDLFGMGGFFSGGGRGRRFGHRRFGHRRFGHRRFGHRFRRFDP
jgi:hypothetical protein